jgi:hypothetical protein
MPHNIRATYWVFFGITALAVFFAGWVVGFVGIRAFSFFVFGETTDPWRQIGSWLIDHAKYLGVLVGLAWSGFVLFRACQRNVETSYFHRHFWPAAILIGIWAFVKYS